MASELHMHGKSSHKTKLHLYAKNDNIFTVTLDMMPFFHGSHHEKNFFWKSMICVKKISL